MGGSELGVLFVGILGSEGAEIFESKQQQISHTLISLTPKPWPPKIFPEVWGRGCTPDRSYKHTHRYAFIFPQSFQAFGGGWNMIVYPNLTVTWIWSPKLLLCGVFVCIFSVEFFTFPKRVFSSKVNPLLTIWIRFSYGWGHNKHGMKEYFYVKLRSLLESESIYCTLKISQNFPKSKFVF